MDKKYLVTKKYLMDIVLNSLPNTKIPSERDLMEQLGYSRPTIQRAINNLQLEGYLYKVDRQGTFTVERKLLNRPLNRLLGFSQEVNETNAASKTVLIEHKIVKADERLSKIMGLPVGTVLHYCERLRKRDNDPIMLDYSYFAEFAIPGIKTDDFIKTVYGYIEDKSKLQISHGDLLIDAVIPEEHIAELLELSSDMPVIKTEQLTRLKDGRVFEYTINYTDPARYKMHVQSVR